MSSQNGTEKKQGFFSRMWEKIAVAGKWVMGEGYRFVKDVILDNLQGAWANVKIACVWKAVYHIAMIPVQIFGAVALVTMIVAMVAVTVAVVVVVAAFLVLTVGPVWVIEKGVRWTIRKIRGH